MRLPYIYVTHSRQLCKTLLTRTSLCLYNSKSFDDSAVITFHIEFISNRGVPVAQLGPSVCFHLCVNPIPGREETCKIPYQKVTPLFCSSSFLRCSLFLMSNMSYTYGKTHCCIPPEVPPEEYKKTGNFNKLILTTLW